MKEIFHDTYEQGTGANAISVDRRAMLLEDGKLRLLGGVKLLTPDPRMPRLPVNYQYVPASFDCTLAELRDILELAEAQSKAETNEVPQPAGVRVSAGRREVEMTSYFPNLKTRRPRTPTDTRPALVWTGCDDCGKRYAVPERYYDPDGYQCCPDCTLRQTPRT